MLSDAALLLTNRISPSIVKPLRAKEFWKVAAVGPLDELPGLDASTIGARVGDMDLGERVASLLDAGSGFALARQEIESKGIRLLAYGAEGYPQRLVDRLGYAAPPMLYTAGPHEWLEISLLGVVGSRDVDENGAEVARSAAGVAKRTQRGIISGGAKGVDIISMDAAYSKSVPSVGLTAEGLERASRRRELRDAVAEERLLLASPYAPRAGFTVGNAMGRNKLIYGLADCTLVVASDHDSGGTWAGATEALRRSFGAVAVWTGPGSGPGNKPLIARGAAPVESLDDWDPNVPPPPPQHRSSSTQIELDL